jgi:hypothetical protein
MGILPNWSSTVVPEPSEWFVAVAEVVDRITSRWALAGALAAGRYRLAPRATNDVDLYVEWRDDLVSTLEAAGYAVGQSIDPNAEHPHLLRCRRGQERVDVMIPVVDYQELALDRARDHVLTVEDVIVHKLIAWRPRDRDDVVSILAAGHELDRDYIEHWAKEWDATERWREATSAR